MIEFLLAAPQSGSGKTVMACALLGALRHRGFSPCAFKCGPDYIDPMFHRSVLGVACHNLDLFLTPEERLRCLYAAGTAGHDAALCEGAMGLYDGLGGTDRASAWHMAQTLGLPVLLVLRPKGASLTLAAQVRGLRDFRPDSPLAGILLSDCRPALYASLAPMLEKETGLPVLGYLPPMPEAVFESRHLGLYTAGEISDIKARVEALAQCALQTVDWQRLLPLCQLERKVPGTKGAAANSAPVARIAVARDEAFCFTYAETLETLEQAGAALMPFSPLYDAEFPPEADGLYLPGGYPELYAARLSQNRAMRESIVAALARGMPTVAECGGFLYLGQSLEDPEGCSWPQVGALPGHGKKTGGLVRFGYATLTAEKDSLLFRTGEQISVHEFHHWDSDENGTDLLAEKPLTGKSWRCGFATPRLYAAFPHLYLAGQPELARRFVAAAAAYHTERETISHGSDE